MSTSGPSSRDERDTPLCRVALVFDIGAYRDYAYLWARARAHR